jgi:choline-sulfatase
MVEPTEMQNPTCSPDESVTRAARGLPAWASPGCRRASLSPRWGSGLFAVAWIGACAPPARSLPAAPPPASSAPSRASAAPAVGDAGPQTATKPRLNVLLITIDALRAEMPWSGYGKDIAPNLTALQKESVSFSRGYALSSVTSKSLGGMLAGRYPSELVRTNSFFTYYLPDNDMFPEALQAAGVRTIGVQAHWSLKHDRGYSQGFDVWDMVPNLLWGMAADTQVTGELHTRALREMLQQHVRPGEPFFAWAHYMDPHQDYQKHPGAPSWGDSDRGLYDAEVWYADNAVGQLLTYVDAQPWAANTAIMVTSDHGEAFGEHGMSGHAFELWEVLVRVPWFAKIPGVAPRTIDAARSHIDLAPTVLDLLGVAAPSWLHGQSLLPEMRGEVPAASRMIVCDLPEDSHCERRRAIIDGDHKLTVLGLSATPRLFDLASDPGETNDLATSRPEELERMMTLWRRSEEQYPRRKPVDR